MKSIALALTSTSIALLTVAEIASTVLASMPSLTV